MQHKFNTKKFEEIIRKENAFIKSLLSVAALPSREHDDPDDDLQPQEKPPINNTSNNQPSRATSLKELEERLKTLTSNKKKLSYKDKLVKKGLKNRMKKKNKQDQRNATSKLERAAKLTLATNGQNDGTDKQDEKMKIVNDKIAFNSDNKLLFGKIDFGDVGQKKQEVKKTKDLKKISEQLVKEKEKYQQLEQRGAIKELVEIKEKKAWKNALAKAEGEKVKDDPILIKQSIKRKDQKVRSSEKKWKSRIEAVEKLKEKKQKRRTENIDKRKHEKKIKKMKTAAKRGRIIPGF